MNMLNQGGMYILAQTYSPIVVEFQFRKDLKRYNLFVLLWQKLLLPRLTSCA